MLGGERVLSAARELAAESRHPEAQPDARQPSATYSHNDPAGAYPNNAFFAHLIPFLDGIAGS